MRGSDEQSRIVARWTTLDPLADDQSKHSPQLGIRCVEVVARVTRTAVITFAAKAIRPT
jgi:hypothetical protein